MERTMTIIRKRTFAASASTLEILINGKPMDEVLVNGEKITVRVPAEAFTLSAVFHERMGNAVMQKGNKTVTAGINPIQVVITPSKVPFAQTPQIELL